MILTILGCHGHCVISKKRKASPKEVCDLSIPPGLCRLMPPISWRTRMGWTNVARERLDRRQSPELPGLLVEPHRPPPYRSLWVFVAVFYRKCDVGLCEDDSPLNFSKWFSGQFFDQNLNNNWQWSCAEMNFR